MSAFEEDLVIRGPEDGGGTATKISSWRREPQVTEITPTRPLAPTETTQVAKTASAAVPFPSRPEDTPRTPHEIRPKPPANTFKTESVMNPPGVLTAFRERGPVSGTTGRRLVTGRAVKKAILAA